MKPTERALPEAMPALVWCDDETDMAVTLSANLSRKEILHITDSTKLEHSTK